MKNVICMPAMVAQGAPPPEPFVQRCAYSWHNWATKHGYEFYFIDSEFEDSRKVPTVFQRMKLLEALDKNSIQYDKVCAVDWDTFIMPWAPDFFPIVGDTFGATADEGYAPALNRSIRMARENFFPEVTDLRWSNYFNGGFVIYDKKHKPALDEVYEFFHTKNEQWCKANKSPNLTDDQTLLNFTVRKHKFPITLLPRSFNIMDYNLKTLFDRQTDALGRTFDPKITFRDVTDMIHMTGDSKFRNDVTGWLFANFKEELGL